MRDDFPKIVRDTLARRVAWRCSNPQCRRLTCGPHTQPDQAISVGVAAHITAASSGGPRYDPLLTSGERCSIGNGVWLCQICARLVDSDTARFPVDVLRTWKAQAEANVRFQLEGDLREAVGPSGLVEKIDALIVASQQNAVEVDNLKSSLREYLNALIDRVTAQSAPAVAAGMVQMIPLDTGYWIRPEDVAAEGLCQCDRQACVGNEGRVYCYWHKNLPEWVIGKQLYWRCYDEPVVCPRCLKSHKRGHVGKLERCAAPYRDQLSQTD